MTRAGSGAAKASQAADLALEAARLRQHRWEGGKLRTELRRSVLIDRMQRRSGGLLPRRTGAPARAAALLAALALLAGCETRGGKIPYDPAGFGPPDRLAAGVEAYDVPLGPLDVLRISVFRVPELSGEYQVDVRGIIDLPLVGSINVRDQNAEQFAATLEGMYAAKYLNDPDVTVRVQSTNQLNVTVEGGVNAPGIYALPGHTTLLGAIALARGFNQQDSNPKRVAIFRKKGGETVAAAFDVPAIRHGEMKDPLVYPGDTVVIDSSKIRAIYRDLIQTLPMIAVFNTL